MLYYIYPQLLNSIWLYIIQTTPPTAQKHTSKHTPSQTNTLRVNRGSIAVPGGVQPPVLLCIPLHLPRRSTQTYVLAWILQIWKSRYDGGVCELTNNSGSTSIAGVELLNFISCLVTVRQFFTGSTRFWRL